MSTDHAAPEITQEPDAKKQKTDETVIGWPQHKLNINKGIMKESEGKLFSEIAASDCDILQGIGVKSVEVCEALGVKTVTDLADYKYYKMAKAIAALAPLEEADGRQDVSKMNVDTAVDIEYETKTLAEILAAPVSALQGLSERAANILGELNVKTVEDLATFKFCVWAEAIVTMSGFEHKLNAAERKVERMAKKLES